MSHIKVKTVFLHQTDRMGSPGVNFRCSRNLTWISNYFKHSLVGQILMWKLFFYMKQTGWGHLGSFLEIRFFTWISDYHFRHSLVRQILKWKLFSSIKRTGWGHMGSFLEIQKICPKDHFFWPFLIMSHIKVKPVFLHQTDRMGSPGVNFRYSKKLTWISNSFKQLLGQIFKWKLFFYIKQTGWGHLGSFLEVQEIWPQCLIILNIR